VSPEVHAALVGGALAGLTVVLGVGLTEWCSRVRSRRQAIEDATHRLTIVVPHVTIAFSQRGRTTVDRSSGAPWFDHYEEVLHLTSLIRRSARWPMRRATAIRREVEDLAARIFGADLAADSDGRYLTSAQLLEITTLGLSRVVFAKTLNLDELSQHYRESGPTPRPELHD
jgi:hypothetical protein